MPTDLVKRIDLGKLYPPFLDKLLETIDACRKRGAYYVCTLGYRTFQEQTKLYFQGRTTPGKVVTNAQAGYSLHNYGVAVDHVRDGDLVKVGLQPEWAAEGYKILKEEGERQGLQVGVPSIPGGDLGHVQLPFVKKLKRREKDILAELKAIYLDAPDGQQLKTVWRKLDEWGFDT